MFNTLPAVFIAPVTVPAIFETSSNRLVSIPNAPPICCPRLTTSARPASSDAICPGTAKLANGFAAS